jgi:hypothetical protein
VVPNFVERSILIVFQHFERFIEHLESRGVDLSRVSISKAEIALWG